MKRTTLHIFLLAVCFLLGGTVFGQKDWSLVNNGSWIQVYKSDMSNSGYKRIKVECTVDGTIDRLVEILNDVNNHKTWIYNTKNAHIIKKVNTSEYYYYTETSLPWPMQNRDAVVHIRFQKDNASRSLNIVAVGEPNYLSAVSGKVRVPRSSNTWQVTVPAPNKLHIVYIFEADPGGNLPSWLVNAFVNKGPYESFKKLSELLKK
jgi:START domain